MNSRGEKNSSSPYVTYSLIVMESLLDFILALATLLSGAGWLTERRKRKADSEKAELDVSTIYVKEFNENIVTPLKEELAKNRAAIHSVVTCPRYPDCPVVREINDHTSVSQS